MKLEFLKWDSDFFGFKIGMVSSFTNDLDFKKLLKQAQEQNFKLLYCFANPLNETENKIYSQYGILVDKKITYYQKLEEKKYELPSNVEEYLENFVDDAMYSLAIEGGKYSRFRTDKNFPDGSFEKLYKKWIENSLNKTFADVIYVYKQEKLIKGILLLKIINDIGIISLISVDQNLKRKGIGTKLINTAYYYFYKNNIYNIEVVTQKDNIAACNFYEKNNFKIKNIQNIYHIWL